MGSLRGVCQRSTSIMLEEEEDEEMV